MAPDKRDRVLCDACGKPTEKNPDRHSEYLDTYYCRRCWKYWEEGA